MLQGLIIQTSLSTKAMRASTSASSSDPVACCIGLLGVGVAHKGAGGCESWSQLQGIEGGLRITKVSAMDGSKRPLKAHLLGDGSGCVAGISELSGTSKGL